MSFNRFFTQIGTLKNRTGYDQYGKEQQTSGTSVSCRFQEASKTVVHPDGSVEKIDAMAYFNPTININQGDHFVFNGIDYRVFDIRVARDGRGIIDHNTARLVKWQS